MWIWCNLTASHTPQFLVPTTSSLQYHLIQAHHVPWGVNISTARVSTPNCHQDVVLVCLSKPYRDLHWRCLAKYSQWKSTWRNGLGTPVESSWALFVSQDGSENKMLCKSLRLAWAMGVFWKTCGLSFLGKLCWGRRSLFCFVLRRDCFCLFFEGFFFSPRCYYATLSIILVGMEHCNVEKAQAIFMIRDVSLTEIAPQPHLLHLFTTSSAASNLGCIHLSFIRHCVTFSLATLWPPSREVWHSRSPKPVLDGF